MLPILARMAARAASSDDKKQIEMQIDTRDLKTLAEKIKRLGPNNTHIRSGLEKIGTRWVARIKANFRNGVDPYGNKWAPIHHRKGQPLLDTGRLRNSIKHDVRGIDIYLTSPLIYADTHNNGRGAIKKRRFTPDKRGLPRKWLDEYETIMLEQVNKALE